MFPTAHSPTGGRYLECWICRLGGAMSVPLTQDKVNKCHYTRRGVGCAKALMRHNLQKVQHPTHSFVSSSCLYGYSIVYMISVRHLHVTGTLGLSRVKSY